MREEDTKIETSKGTQNGRAKFYGYINEILLTTLVKLKKKHTLFELAG